MGDLSRTVLVQLILDALHVALLVMRLNLNLVPVCLNLVVLTVSWEPFLKSIIRKMLN
jgi:hypothetical protein